MSTKTTLFKLLDAADGVFLDDYEVEERVYGVPLGGATGLVRLTTADETDYYFAEQEVELNEGHCYAIATAEEDYYSSDGGAEDGEPHQLRFTVQRLLTAADLES